MKRYKNSFVACFFLFLLLGSGGGSWAEAEVLRSGLYIIQMADSDMTAAATREAVNSPMILWRYRPTATWAFRHEGNNIYTVRTNSTVLDDSSSRPGASLTIRRPNQGASQQWRLQRVGKFYKFINVQTGRAMTLGNGQRVQGSGLQSKAPTDSTDQLFCIQKRNGPRFCGGKGRGEDNSYGGKGRGEDNRYGGKGRGMDDGVNSFEN